MTKIKYVSTYQWTFTVLVVQRKIQVESYEGTLHALVVPNHFGRRSGHGQAMATYPRMILLFFDNRTVASQRISKRCLQVTLMASASAAVAQRNQDATCYVGGLDDKVDEELLWELFVQASIGN